VCVCVCATVRACVWYPQRGISFIMQKLIKTDENEIRKSRMAESCPIAFRVGNTVFFHGALWLYAHKRYSNRHSICSDIESDVSACKLTIEQSQLSQLQGYRLNCVWFTPHSNHIHTYLIFVNRNSFELIVFKMHDLFTYAKIANASAHIACHATMCHATDACVWCIHAAAAVTHCSLISY